MMMHHWGHANLPRPFVTGDVSHWLTLLGIAGCAGAMIWRARQRDTRPVWAERLLAVILLLNFPISLPIMQQSGLLTADNALPFHLCDVTALCAGLALLTRRRALVELTWFWGLAGAGNSIFTPTARFAFPHPENLWFFAMHGGIVIAALYLVLGLKLIPQRGAIWRALLWANVYLVVVALINWRLGTNYGYVCRKPDAATLLDYLGPWPWYLVVVQFVACAFFAVLDAPFWRMRRRNMSATQADQLG